MAAGHGQRKTRREQMLHAFVQTELTHYPGQEMIMLTLSTRWDSVFSLVFCGRHSIRMQRIPSTVRTKLNEEAIALCPGDGLLFSLFVITIYLRLCSEPDPVTMFILRSHERKANHNCGNIVCVDQIPITPSSGSLVRFFVCVECQPPVGMRPTIHYNLMRLLHLHSSCARCIAMQLKSV